MCEAKHPEHGVQCELDSTGHMSHFAIGPTGTVKWRNEGVGPVPLPQPKARNGVTEEERKTAQAVQEAIKTERDRVRGAEGRREPTQVILGPIAPFMRGSETSEAAAVDIEEHLGDSEQRVFSFIHAHPGATVEQCFITLGMKENNVRPRVWDMCGKNPKNPRTPIMWKLDGDGINTSGSKANRYVTYDPETPGAPAPLPKPTAPWNLSQSQVLVPAGPPVGRVLRDFN